MYDDGVFRRHVSSSQEKHQCLGGVNVLSILLASTQSLSLGLLTFCARIPTDAEISSVVCEVEK